MSDQFEILWDKTKAPSDNRTWIFRLRFFESGQILNLNIFDPDLQGWAAQSLGRRLLEKDTDEGQADLLANRAVGGRRLVEEFSKQIALAVE
jgi:hypothetical protein